MTTFPVFLILYIFGRTYLTYFYIVLFVFYIPIGSDTSASSIPERSGDDVLQEDFLRQKVELMKRYMNQEVDPCQDMYEYACGNFEHVRDIPDDEPLLTTFYDPNIKTVEILRNILEALPENTTEDAFQASPVTKLKRFYNSCMDRKMLERRGVLPILELFDSLGGWPVLDSYWNGSNFRVEDILADLNSLNYKLLLHIAVDVDPINPDLYTLQINPGSVGVVSLSDFQGSKPSNRLRAYKNYVVNVLKIFGVPESSALETAKHIAFVERLFLLAVDGLEDKSIIDKYDKTTIVNLQQLFPTFDFPYFIERTFNKSLSENQEVILLDIVYVKNVVQILQSVDPKTIVNWLLWRVFLDDVNFLDTRFDAENRQLQDVLTGVQSKKERWKFCQELSTDLFEKLLSAEFVKRAFSQEVKTDVQFILEDIRDAFRDLIEEKEWLRRPTKWLALEKLSRMKFSIGYDEEVYAPEKVQRESAAYEIHGDKFYENIISIRRAEARRTQAHLGKLVDNYDERVPPFEYNAGYATGENRVEITTAFLQPPLYDRRQPKAMNYAAMGMFIGHEMGHALDKYGWEYDITGFYKEWWDEDSKRAFIEKSKCFENQYNNYTFKNQSIDGHRTLGENMSDNTGLRQAYFGYLKWLERNTNSEALKRERLPGLNLNNLQLFFLAFSQMWCLKVRPEFITPLLTDVHAPGPYRVIGSLSNFDEFAAQFGCEFGTSLNPVEKCELW